MSRLYDPKFNRSKYGNYDKNKNFTNVIGGTDAYFLEDEMNELQEIQNEIRADILRSQYHSGIISKHKDDIILQNEDNYKSNLLSFEKMQVLINGYILNIEGNLGYLNENLVLKKNVNNVILPEPPKVGYREDLVYLEVWFKEINYLSDLWVNGNKNNYKGIIDNDLKDSRINGETCRRIQLQWEIRVASGIDFTSNSYGFDNKLKDGNVKAYGGHYAESVYSFWRSDKNLSNSSFNDKGLWVAGEGKPGDMGTVNGYVYAIPLFRVLRRNSSKYSLDNVNGANLFVEGEVCFPDRPDNKFANIIYKDDIVDLRNINNFHNVNYNSLLQSNFTKLLTGNLKTNSKTNIIKEYFGINPIVPDDSTLVYLDFNKDLNNKATLNHLPPKIVDNSSYEYVLSIEQEGLIFKENDYLFYDVDKDINVGRVSMMIKLLDSYDKDLWSLVNDNNEMLLSCSINNGEIIVRDNIDMLISIPLSNTNLNFNEFGQLGVVWSKIEQKMHIIINGNVIEVIDISDRVTDSPIRGFIVGYCDYNRNYCKNVILDEIEYSTNYSTSFATLPVDFRQGHAKLCLDIQKGRRVYTNVASKSIMTIQINKKSDELGNMNIEIDAPVGSLFTDMTPRLYHDNEAIIANVNWSGLYTNKLIGQLTNLGSNLEYNFVLVYEVQFDENQGFNRRPEKILKIVGEKNNDEFYAVRVDKRFEQYSIDKLSLNHNSNSVLPTKEFYAYNTNISDKLGFGCTIKYYVSGFNGNVIKIPKNIYNQNIINIYNVNVYETLDMSNVLKEFWIDGQDIYIKLNVDVVEDQIIEVLAGFDKTIAVYNHITGGIENLTKVEEVRFTGDGSSKIFKNRFDDRVISSLGSMLNGITQHIALVDNKSMPVNVEFKDTFVIFTFDKPINNKSDILIYVNTEYNPVRSERFQVWYETLIYQGEEDREYISSLDDCDIITHLDSIFVITEGINYPIGDSLNKNNVNSTYLPALDIIDTKLFPTYIFGESTNIKASIDYALANDNDFNDSIPLLNKLKIKLSNNKINRGYTGYITVDNKSLYSNIKLPESIPHLCVLPLLIKDKNDKLMLAVITTYNENKDILIDSNYNKSAFDIFKLDENILIK